MNELVKIFYANNRENRRERESCSKYTGKNFNVM